MKTKTARPFSLRIRLYAEERDLLRLNAGIRGLSVSDYVRQCCLSFHLRKSPVEKERLRQLARIGSNINQIGKWVNRYKGAVQVVEVLAALTSLEREIKAFMAMEKPEDEA